MNSQNAFGSNSNSSAKTVQDAETTLRLLANLPAPRSLEERVIAGLRSAPPSGRIFNWPALLSPSENWLRSAAAAAIVFVVVGGGWGVYSNVQSNSAATVPQRVGPAAGFSNAGAVRVPQNLPSPVVTQPAQPGLEQSKPSDQERNSTAPVVRSHKKGDTMNKAATKPSISVAR